MKTRSLYQKQLLSALGLILFTLVIIGLCTNTIVLPFVDFSGAVANKTKNALSPLDVPTEGGEANPPLSFLEKLRYFGEDTEGKTLSGEPFDAEFSFVRADAALSALPSEKTVFGKTALVARMGFLVRENADGTRALLDGNANLIMSAMPEGFDFTGQWDAHGNAVFVSAAGYVRFDAENRVFVETEYTPELYPDEKLDVPVYYNRAPEDVSLFYRDGKYGYYSAKKERVVYQNSYSKQSYQFSEGFGALGSDDGMVLLKFENNNDLILRYFLSHGTFVEPQNEEQRIPGLYRMSHGLMPVIRKTETGSEYVVLTAGNARFYLPRDFTPRAYTDGVFLLEKGGKFGYLDYTGRWIVKPELVSATPFSEGLAVVKNAEGKAGVIDTTGAFVIPCEFEEITFSGGTFTLYSEGRWVVLHKVR